MRSNVSQWLAWWYGAIALGFLLLGIDHIVMRDRTWLVVVRFVIAGGFAFLAWFEIYGKRSGRH